VVSEPVATPTLTLPPNGEGIRGIYQSLFLEAQKFARTENLETWNLKLETKGADDGTF
jgi:hypothetical protein